MRKLNEDTLCRAQEYIGETQRKEGRSPSCREIMHTHGDSMKDIGIVGGDLVVVRRQSCADDGQIVVAFIDGEATLKRLYHKDGKIILHPENKELQDIIVEQCEIQGVLVSCIKMY